MLDSVTAKKINSFFHYGLEERAKESILSGNVGSVRSETEAFLREISEIPLAYFMEYIYCNCRREPILAADVFQFSNIDDATINVCEAVCLNGNEGLSCRQIGRLLLNDGIERNEDAFNKYGENHIKTAEALGLAFKINRRCYYISGTGIVFYTLPVDVREKLLNRLILRNKLITQLILVANYGVVDLEAFLYDLSASTYIRRKTNIKRIISVLTDSKEYDFSFMKNNIVY